MREVNEFYSVIPLTMRRLNDCTKHQESLCMTLQRESIGKQLCINRIIL